MGLMVDGRWQSDLDRQTGPDGQFIRSVSQFRNWITPDGAPGPTGSGGYKAEAGRYHLYVSYACPWAHRVLIYRSVLGLEDAIGVSVVHPVNIPHGWEFSDFPGATPDHVNGARYLYEVYARAVPDYTGKVTVPLLWDKQTGTIVNNESADLIRMLGTHFRAMGGDGPDFYPKHLRQEIDAVNETVYAVNNGVYRCGFARSQAAYDEAAAKLFAALAALHARLQRTPFLVGEAITEADWRLFTSAIRFDPVYYVHFKCSQRHYADFPGLGRHLDRLRQYPGVAGTIWLDHIRHHYYRSHLRINPHGIIPIGPLMPWESGG